MEPGHTWIPRCSHHRRGSVSSLHSAFSPWHRCPGTCPRTGKWAHHQPQGKSAQSCAPFVQLIFFSSINMKLVRVYMCIILKWTFADSSYQAFPVFSCCSSKELDSWRRPDSFTITQNSSWPSYRLNLRSNKTAMALVSMSLI